MLRLATSDIKDSKIKKQLLRGGTGALVVRVLSLLAALLASVVLARVLGDSGYGLYAFALSATTLLALPVNFGVPTLVIRETAGAEASGDWVALRSIQVWALRMNVMVALAISGAILLFVWIGGASLSGDSRLVLVAAATLILPAAIISTLGATLRGLRWVISGLFPSEVLRPLLISALVAASLYVWVDDLPPEIALGMNFIATLLVLLLLILLVRHALPTPSLAERERVFKTRQWLKSLLPLGAMSGLHLINQNMDLIMLGVFRDTAEVGHYKVAVSGAAFVIFGLSAIQVVAMPYITRYFSEKDHDRLQSLASVFAGASVLLALPVILIFVVWGHDLLAFVYGDSFLASWEPLIVLSVAQLGNAVFGLVWPLLVMTGHEYAGVRGLVFATATNVVLNLAFIPKFGAFGAAMATGASVLVWNILFWVSVREHLGIDGSLFGLLRRGKARKKPMYER